MLVGGLYGVALGGAFFGESMFHRVTDASKASLSALVDRLRARGYPLLDTQWVTGHLAQFGAIEVPRRRYLRMLDEALKIDAIAWSASLMDGVGFAERERRDLRVELARRCR